MTDLTRVCNEVKRRIIPDPKLRADVRTKAEEIRATVEYECKTGGLSAEVRIDGSVAKDTWIRDNADVDIFMRVSSNLTKAQLREVCLPIAKRALYPNRIVERFAEHPYVEAMVALGKRRMLRVNVVPCYGVRMGEWLSATDRTPYHTEYVLNHMTLEQRDEVRVLKAFMGGIGAYGADIKTGGFSGMLCETLIVARGDFEHVVKEFSSWKEGQLIDVENYYKARRDEPHKLFREPLIVIDPVDQGRNLAAAVRSEQLWNFVAASRQVVAEPSTRFFDAPKIKQLTSASYGRLVRRRGSTILAVVMGRMDVVVDILWSQLYRTERALVGLLENNDFSVIRSASWSDERSLSVILLELEDATIPGSRLHLGPPVSRVAESASFLSKHLASEGTISGPWVEANRWVVQKKRDFTSAADLLRTALRTGGRSVGVASEPAHLFKKRVEVLSGSSVGRLIVRSPEFAKAVRVFLAGRPPWLE